MFLESYIKIYAPMSNNMIITTQQKQHDAILPRRGSITRAMARRLQEDWAIDAGEGPRILISLRVYLELIG